MNKFLLILTALLSCNVLFSQDISGRNDAIQTMKVAFITKKLNLTTSEAQSFWPVYNQYENELEKIRIEHKKTMREIKDDFSSLSDAEIEKFVDAQIAFRQKEIDVLKKHHPEFKKTLPVKKVALLYRAEEDFKRHLIKQIKSN
jgi:hypothetical protein